MTRRIAQPRAGPWLALALAASVALAGCVTARPPDLDPRLDAASAAFGGGFDYVYVPSDGRLADEAFLAMSRVAGPQKIARDLATLMATAETQSVRVMVTGPSKQKTVAGGSGCALVLRGTPNPSSGAALSRRTDPRGPACTRGVRGRGGAPIRALSGMNGSMVPCGYPAGDAAADRRRPPDPAVRRMP